MKNANTIKVAAAVAATVTTLALLMSSGGCQSDAGNAKEQAENEKFHAKHDSNIDIFNAPHEERVSKFIDVQASNGARNDGMLYAHHFDAGHLNSLGRTKVLHMLADCETCEPVVVHLVSVGEGELLEQRKASVELYLKTAEGPNKLTFHPAAADIVRFAKTESGKVEDMGLPKATSMADQAPAAGSK
jgi:hypothetical protein